MNKTTGYIYLVLTFFIWGSLYVAAKYAMAQIPPLLVLAVRYGLSVIVLYFIMKKRGIKKIKKEHRKLFLSIGAAGYFGGIAFQLIGTDLIDASLSSLINSLNPVVIPIIAAIFLNEKLNIKICISIFLSVVGIYIVLGVGTSGGVGMAGIIINILSLLFWSASCCMVRGISADYDPIQITLYAMAIAFCFAAPSAALNLCFEPCTITAEGIISLLYIAFVCTALSHVFWNRALKILDATTCSLFYPIQPLTSALLGMALLHEKLSSGFWAGAAIICIGILIVVSEPKHKPKKTFQNSNIQ